LSKTARVFRVEVAVQELIRRVDNAFQTGKAAQLALLVVRAKAEHLEAQEPLAPRAPAVWQESAAVLAQPAQVEMRELVEREGLQEQGAVGSQMIHVRRQNRCSTARILVGPRILSAGKQVVIVNISHG
jgi:hypothetical protein